MDLSSVKAFLIESPGWRTFFSFVIPILAAFFSGTFVTELTINGVLSWKSFYSTISFYVLIVLSTLIYVYNKAIYLHDKGISKFADTEYCTAYVRSKCLPEAAKKYQELIRTGNGGELKQAMDEIRKILK